MNNIFGRRVANVLPDKKGLDKLMSERKIKLYQGFDPTGGRLHLGHSIGIRKLMDFANEGHEVIFLFGTGTVLAGDPSQRENAREKIAAEQINTNISGWKDQVAPIVDWNKVSTMHNGEWLLQLGLRDVIEIASHISAVQLFKRDMFQKRIDRGDTIWTHELLYPLLQGYDSVAMNVDLEIGGTDQEFNMLIGRELQKKMNSREKYVLTVPMIVGTDGKQMSKSSGNCVWLDDTAQDMFGKLMALPDEHIVTYMELVTDIDLTRVKEVEEGIKSGKLHPMDAKKELAFDVARQFHGNEKAKESQNSWEETFQKGEIPTDIPTHKLKGEEQLVNVLISAGISKSKSEARRLIEQGGVELNGEKITQIDFSIKSEGALKIGKHKFLKIEK
jgi:tyrosyl-tRNA synthetase